MEITLGYSVVRNARKYPHKNAILCGEQRRTYQEFNSIELMEAYLAHLKVEAITVPLNAWGLDKEIQHQAGFTGCKMFIFHQDFLERVEQIRPRLPEVQEWIFIGTPPFFCPIL